MRRTLIRLVHETEGATSVEYALIATLVAVAIIGGILSLSGALDGVWTWMAGKVESSL